ncbi:MAG: branched-chain amino acid ABC transporter permease [Deltaproteobacteria bacterium]|nr:branched-chain amino acid ABC transporter permease [Deltaproteobacteria bacterium]MBW1815922.1 branched-chain amino acid ABC transporter permease [Deltaproteobacteria bacterium]MBW2283749.1 branched-chain amino acid ABC transporter permease [Deltaproteobacteria bacterium]
MNLQGFIIQLLSGLSVGMVIFLIAVGLSLIFGTLKVLNLSHAALYMLGAYLCFWLSSMLSQFSGSFWISLLIAPVLVALFGGFLEVLLLRRIYDREMLEQFLLTFALILIIGDLCKLGWGVDYHIVDTPWPLDAPVIIKGLIFPRYNLFLILFGPLLYAGLWSLIRYTRLGSIIRAVTHNREMANALGVNVPYVYTGVFMLGCWLAGLGGALVAPMAAVMPGMDAVVLIDCFIIVVIGGLGSLSGAFLGSIIFGLVTAFGILVAPRLAIAFGFILMIVVLIIRPWGLMGKPE